MAPLLNSNHPPQRSPRLRRFGIVVGVLLIATGAVGTGASYYVAGELARSAKRAVPAPPADLNCESIRLLSQTGATLAGWHIRQTGNNGVVVLLHAIRGNRADMIERARLFRDAGYSIVMIDQQAHGESTGDNITFGYLERFDAAAAVAFARQEHPGEPIAVVGRSLGGAATILASPLHVDAIILESVYPTIEEALDNRLSFRIGPLAPLAAFALKLQLQPRLGFSVDALRPIDRLELAGCPLLIMSGAHDLHTTEIESRRMYERARGPKAIAIFPTAAHEDLMAADPVLYRSESLSFLQKSLGASQGAAAPAPGDQL